MELASISCGTLSLRMSFTLQFYISSTTAPSAELVVALFGLESRRRCVDAVRSPPLISIACGLSG